MNSFSLSQNLSDLKIYLKSIFCGNTYS